MQFPGASLFAEQHEQPRIYVELSYQNCGGEAILLIYEKMLQSYGCKFLAQDMHTQRLRSKLCISRKVVKTNSSA